MKTNHASDLTKTFLERNAQRVSQATTKEEVTYYAWYAMGSIWAFSMCEEISISDRQLWLRHIESLEAKRKAELSQGGDRTSHRNLWLELRETIAAKQKADLSQGGDR